MVKTLTIIVALVLLHGTTFGQFPPILRQSLTTNTANNPTAAGQTPVWNGTTWTMLSTNATGGGGNDNLWTNTTIEYLPIRTNTFGFAKEAGGLWLGSNSPIFWGALGASDSLVSVRNAVAGESPNNNFYFFVRGTPTNVTSVEGSLAGASSQLTVAATNDLINSTYVNMFAQTDGAASLNLGTNLITRASIAASGNSYLNGAAARLGIGNAAPDAPLHVTGASFLQGGITNWGPHRHTNGAFVGAIFQSSTASGDAVWSTNLGTVVVTNLYVTNINGVGAGAFTNLYWTNDTAVLKGTAVGVSPRAALRWGLLGSGPGVNDGTNYWNLTNVGFCSFAVGSNVIARGDYSIAGGSHTIVQTNALASIAWGSNSVIQASNHSCVISGGSDSEIGAFGRHATISGGFDHSVGASTLFATIAGGQQNTIDASVTSGTVSGGTGNRIRSTWGFIGGGNNNDIIAGTVSTIPGGQGNNVQSGSYNTVGGGIGNVIGHSLSGSAPGNVIGGGVTNYIGFVNGATTSNSFIGGGWMNSIGGASSDQSVIVGGERNANDLSPWSFIGGGLNNSVSPVGTNSSIVGGASNLISNSGWSFIGGGLSNGIAGGGNFNAILGGNRNQLSSSGGHSFIIAGSSNRLTGGEAYIIGNGVTNTVDRSLDIGFSSESSKSTFTSTNTIFRTSLATAPDTVVDLTADNQVVDATKRSFVRLSSNDGTAGNRTFVLTGTNVTSGALLVLEWTDTEAGEVVDDSACSGAGNHRLSATWTPTQYDTLSLIFNGTDWVERGRSTN